MRCSGCAASKYVALPTGPMPPSGCTSRALIGVVLLRVSLAATVDARPAPSRRWCSEF